MLDFEDTKRLLEFISKDLPGNVSYNTRGYGFVNYNYRSEINAKYSIYKVNCLLDIFTITYKSFI